MKRIKNYTKVMFCEYVYISSKDPILLYFVKVHQTASSVFLCCLYYRVLRARTLSHNPVLSFTLFCIEPLNLPPPLPPPPLVLYYHAIDTMYIAPFYRSHHYNFQTFLYYRLAHEYVHCKCIYSYITTTKENCYTNIILIKDLLFETSEYLVSLLCILCTFYSSCSYFEIGLS